MNTPTNPETLNDQPGGETMMPLWIPPARAKIMAELSNLSAWRPKEVFLTYVLKLRTRSRRKEHELYQGQVYATNLAARVLEELREDPEHPRPDGALACVHEVVCLRAQGKKGNPTHLVANILSKRFSIICSQELFPLTGVLRSGVFKQCALMIWLWYHRVIADYNGDAGELHAIQQHWAARCTVYQDAAATLFPFGRHAGKKLADIGKRELRWLRARLIDADVLSATLEAIDVLQNRYSYTVASFQQAMRVKHPWRRKVKQERAVRASRLVQHGLEKSQDSMLLGLMSENELGSLRDQLLELQEFSVVFAQVRAAVDTMLAQAPLAYPTVRPLAGTPDEQSEIHRKYEAALNWFRHPVRNGDIDKGAIAEQLESWESAARTRLLQLERELAEPDLQPLNYPRTMRPRIQGADGSVLSYGNYGAFSVNYDSVSQEYVLAVAVHGRHASEHFTPHVGDNLYFVNFPETRFVPPKQTSMLLFPLECGREYQDQVLRELIDRQREAQHLKFAQQNTSAEERLSLENCLPEAAIGSARIVSRQNDAGRREFYLHIPVPLPVPSQTILPDTVIGFHEHRDGYSYAVLTLEGKVLKVGDLNIPEHVLPKEGDRYYNDNYAFEVARAIVDLGVAHNAILGIEDTSWRKQTSLSYEQNRRAFTRPTRKITEIVSYKALLAGLLSPRDVRSVAPSRDCSRCGGRCEKSALHTIWHVECPNCHGRQLLQDNADGLQDCLSCQHVWEGEEIEAESLFTCPTCAMSCPARYNCATVVAHRTMEQLVSERDHMEDQTNLLYPGEAPENL